MASDKKSRPIRPSAALQAIHDLDGNEVGFVSESYHLPEDVIYIGSDDECYESPSRRTEKCKKVYESYLRHGCQRPPLIISASLKGPFDGDKWKNPWQSRSLAAHRAVRRQPKKQAKSTAAAAHLQTSHAASSSSNHLEVLPNPFNLRKRTSEEPEDWLRRPKAAKRQRSERVDLPAVSPSEHVFAKRSRASLARLSPLPAPQLIPKVSSATSAGPATTTTSRVSIASLSVDDASLGNEFFTDDSAISADPSPTRARVPARQRTPASVCEDYEKSSPKAVSTERHCERFSSLTSTSGATAERKTSRATKTSSTKDMNLFETQQDESFFFRAKVETNPKHRAANSTAGDGKPRSAQNTIHFGSDVIGLSDASEQSTSAERQRLLDRDAQQDNKGPRQQSSQPHHSQQPAQKETNEGDACDLDTTILPSDGVPLLFSSIKAPLKTSAPLRTDQLNSSQSSTNKKKVSSKTPITRSRSASLCFPTVEVEIESSLSGAQENTSLPELPPVPASERDNFTPSGPRNAAENSNKSGEVAFVGHEERTTHFDCDETTLVQAPSGATPGRYSPLKQPVQARRAHSASNSPQVLSQPYLASARRNEKAFVRTPTSPPSSPQSCVAPSLRVSPSKATPHSKVGIVSSTQSHKTSTTTRDTRSDKNAIDEVVVSDPMDLVSRTPVGGDVKQVTAVPAESPRIATQDQSPWAGAYPECMHVSLPSSEMDNFAISQSMRSSPPIPALRYSFLNEAAAMEDENDQRIPESRSQSPWGGTETSIPLINSRKAVSSPPSIFIGQEDHDVPNPVLPCLTNKRASSNTVPGLASDTSNNTRPSTPEDQVSSLPTPELTFSLKPFRRFLSPSPRKKKRKSRSKPDGPSDSQDIVANNPWTQESKLLKRVRWAPLPGEEEEEAIDADVPAGTTAPSPRASEDGRSGSEEMLSGNSDDEDYIEAGLSASQRLRNVARVRKTAAALVVAGVQAAPAPTKPHSPPPPTRTLMDILPGEVTLFQKHFAKVDRERNPLEPSVARRFVRDVAAAAAVQSHQSQSPGGSQAVDAVARRFADADAAGIHASKPRGSILSKEESSHSSPPPPPPADDENEENQCPVDDVSAVIDNLGDFLGGWDVDVDLAQAAAQAGAQSGRSSLGLDVSPWS